MGTENNLPSVFKLSTQSQVMGLGKTEARSQELHRMSGAQRFESF